MASESVAQRPISMPRLLDAPFRCPRRRAFGGPTGPPGEARPGKVRHSGRGMRAPMGHDQGDGRRRRSCRPARSRPTARCCSTPSRRSCAARSRPRSSSCTSAPSSSRAAPARATRAPPTSSRRSSPGLGTHDAELFVRTLTRWFQLINLAEDNERVRRLRRARGRARRPPRAAARCWTPCAAWPTPGSSADEAGALLAAAEVRLVLTAHPTEARRRTTLEKLARVFGVLRDLDERPAMPVRRRAPAAAADDPGAVGLRRAARGLADRARRGAQRPGLVRHHADARRARRLPRARGGARGDLPGRVRRGAAAADASARGSAATATATRTSRPR